METTLTSPSIPTQDIHSHIRLMRAIHQLQANIQPGAVPFDSQSGAPLPSDAMILFLDRAVQRFGVWVNAQQDVNPGTSSFSLSQERVPPLDVLMIWHAYMLSPVAYNEDAQANVPGLGKLGAMPWNELPTCIDAGTYVFTPTQAQLAYWENSTGHPFHLEVNQGPSTKPVEVPKFSIDLAQAVLRQSGSIIRMLDVIDKYKDDDKGEWIDHAIEYYPQYMRLPEGNHVPPVEIDIVWHTHQLSGVTYRDECVAYFGSFIGHDDSNPPEVIRQGRKLMHSIFEKFEIPMLPAACHVSGSVRGYVFKDGSKEWSGHVCGLLTGESADGEDVYVTVDASLMDCTVSPTDEPGQVETNAVVQMNGSKVTGTVQEKPFQIVTVNFLGNVKGNGQEGGPVDVGGEVNCWMASACTDRFPVFKSMAGKGDPKCNSGPTGCTRVTGMVLISVPHSTST